MHPPLCLHLSAMYSIFFKELYRHDARDTQSAPPTDTAARGYAQRLRAQRVALAQFAAAPEIETRVRALRRRAPIGGVTSRHLEQALLLFRLRGGAHAPVAELPRRSALHQQLCLAARRRPARAIAHHARRTSHRRGAASL